MKETKEYNFTFRLPKSLKEKLDNAANSERRTSGSYLRNVLESHFENKKKRSA